MAGEIQSISVKSMNNGAHFNYMHATIDLIEANDTVKSKLAEELAALKQAFQVENDCLKLTRKSLLTDEISLWDGTRDNYYMGYKGVVKGLRNLPIGEQRSAAITLWQHIVDYKIDVRMQLDRLTGMLMNFLEDLDAKFDAEVTLLGLTTFRDKLKEANDKVRELLKERDKESSTRETGALRTARQATDTAYQTFIKKMNAYAIIEGTADYQSFIDAMNAQIKRYKQEVLGQTASGSSTSTDKPTDPSEPSEPTEPTEPTEPEPGGEEGETDSPSVI